MPLAIKRTSLVTAAANSVLFNGSSQYLKLPSNSSAWTLNGDFTIECWFNTTTTNQNGIFTMNWSGDWNAVYGNGFSLCTNYVITPQGNTTWSAPSINIWHHIAVVRSGAALSTYLDGVNVGSQTNSNQFGNATTTPGIGLFDTYGGTIRSPFPGYISDLRILKGTALYTSNFTPPTSSLTAITNTSLLTCNVPTIVDGSSNNFTITNNGAATVSSITPFTPALKGLTFKNRFNNGTATPTSNSVLFNGSNQYLSIPYNSNLWLDSSNWTIECWVYLNSLSTYNNIWAHGYGAPNTIRSIVVYMETTTGLLRIAQSPDGSTNYDTSLGITLTTNSWKHVAIVRNGANVTAYLNGTAGTSVTAYNLYNSTTVGHFIGIQGDLQSITAYNGYISNHRVVKGTAVYTSNFTPSTTALTAIADTSLLACNAATIVDGSPNISNATGAFPIYNTTGDGSSNTGGTRADTYSSSLVLAIPMSGANNGTTFTDESANIKGSGTAKTITNNGSIPTLTAISKFYGSSAYFSNASAQSIVFGNYGTDFQFTGDFTIECWVYPTTSGATDGSLFVLQSGGSNYFAFNFDPGTQFNIYNNSGGPSWSPSVSSVITGQWNHFALIRSGNTQQIFVNGISIGTNTASGTLGYSSTSADFARIGGGASGAINSYIQDLRVYKGVAKYTANFTPPVNANIITNNNSATVSSTTPFTVSTATSTMKIKKVNADPATIVTNGLVLNLDASNASSYPGTGTTWTDLSGNGNNGTLYNGPTYTGSFGGIIVFDGVDDYFQANVNTATLDGDPSLSVDMFVRRRTGTNIGGDNGFWGIGGMGQGNSIEGWTPTANLIHLDIYDSTRIATAAYYPENQFVHICWTKNGAGTETTNVKCYINGSEVALTKTRTATRANQFNTSTSGKGICLGRINADAAVYHAPIDIGTFKVYSRALLSNEVLQNYNVTKTRFGL